jgi:hypothetical protein
MYFMTDVAEDTTLLQNTVGSFLSAMEPEESVAFASLVYFYNGRHDVRYNGRILCTRVAPALEHYSMKYIPETSFLVFLSFQEQ